MTYPVSEYEWHLRCQNPYSSIDLEALKIQLNEVTLNSDRPNLSTLLDYIRGGGRVNQALGYAKEFLDDYDASVRIIKAFISRGAYLQAEWLLKQLGSRVFEIDQGRTLRMYRDCKRLRPECVYPVMDLAMAELREGNLKAAVALLKKYDLGEGYLKTLVEQRMVDYMNSAAMFASRVDRFSAMANELEEPTRSLVLDKIAEILRRPRYKA